MAFAGAPIPPEGFGAGFPGLPFPGFGGGFGKSINLDISGGAGAGFPGFFGGLGGGLPGLGFGGAPYIPVTPAGALAGFKGDLIVPIVAVGFALFLLIVIVLAIKTALAWKIGIIDEVLHAKKGKFLRSAPSPQLEEDNLNSLANVVISAINSEKCTQRLLCDLGSYAREGNSMPSLMRLLELMAPDQYKQSLSIMRAAAEKPFDCKSAFPCGPNNGEQQNAETKIKNANATENKLSRRSVEEEALSEPVEELDDQAVKSPPPAPAPPTASKDNKEAVPTRFSRSFYW